MIQKPWFCRNLDLVLLSAGRANVSLIVKSYFQEQLNTYKSDWRLTACTFPKPWMTQALQNWMQLTPAGFKDLSFCNLKLFVMKKMAWCGGSSNIYPQEAAEIPDSRRPYFRWCEYFFWVRLEWKIVLQYKKVLLIFVRIGKFICFKTPCD